MKGDERGMKKISKLFIALLLSSLLLGCDIGKNVSDSSDVPEYVDEIFISDLGKALEKRWKLSDSDKFKARYNQVADGSSEHRELWIELVQSELDVLEPGNYKYANFEDKVLRDKAAAYMKCLQDQMDSLQYMTVDYDKFCELWDAAYNERTKLITEFANEYGLSVSEAYEQDLRDMITNADTVKASEDKQAAIENLVKSIKFTEEKEEDSDESDTFKTFVAVVENNTGYDIEMLYIDINLLDADGVIVETTYASMSEVPNGSKAKMEFSTFEEFKSMKIKLDDYSYVE